MIQWVDAREKLPEQFGEYLVWLKDKEPEYKIEDIPVFDTSHATVGFYDMHQKLWDMYDDLVCNAVLENVDTKAIYYVSHWAELPSGPVFEE